MHSFNKYIFPLILALASCFPGEDPIQPFPRGDVREVKLDMGPSKTDIVFYRLSDASIVATADPRDWDVYFDGEKFRINYLRGLLVAETSSDFETFTDTSGLRFINYENKEAMWTLDSGVFAIDMGLDHRSNASMGVYKFFVDGNTLKYKMLYSDTAHEQMLIATTEAYYNLRTLETVDLPLDHEYDLVFGKYMHYFEEEKINYEVFGALQGGTSAAETSHAFEHIDQSIADTIQMSFRKDIIGYDWKTYNIDKGAYDILDLKHYIIKDRQGFYYKLRFISYYNDKGVSGHPTFEFKLL